MNDNAKKWLAALRSDKYKQTRFRLRDNTGFCCLGVACDLYSKEYSKEHPDVKWEQPKMSFDEHDGYYFLSSTGTLPREVRNWLNLRTGVGRFTDSQLPDLEQNLTKVNDIGMTFKQIANIIESEPYGLFKEKND